MSSRTQPGDPAAPGPLSESVARLCGDLREQVSEGTAAGIDRVLQRLSAPLQLAVVGRVKSGKSTLVNALIGRRVAPTDVGECTRLVTRFQYGTVDRIEVVGHDGSRQAVPCAPDGGLPADLGVDLERVSHVEAYLTNAVLRDLTVIDTPGLGSLNETARTRAERLLGADRPPGAGEDEELDPVSRGAVAGAEAVLYVVTQAVRADDEQALAAFSAATASRDAGPVNAVAVLNKADAVEPESVAGADGDVWRAASILAEGQARVLRPRVADVLPVLGLLAETTETGGFTAADADALRQLARLDRDTRETMLLSADLFTEWECAVPVSARTRLVERLDLHGIRCALQELDRCSEASAGDLRRALGTASGLAELRARVAAVFRERADGLKAAAALASLTSLVHESGDPEEWRAAHDALEALLARPEAHQLRVLEALTLVSSGGVQFPEDLVDEVLRLGGATTDAERVGMPGAGRPEVAAAALERAKWWRSFATFGATPAQSRVAHVVHRAYFLLWRRLSGRA
ncbi:dynamin family protein [Salinifilum ghardaiensis]